MFEALFFLNMAVAFAVFITVTDYWFDTKPMLQELWARRVLGDDVYERNKAPPPKPYRMPPLSATPIVAPPPKPAIPTPTDPPIRVPEKVTWPLVEITASGPRLVKRERDPVWLQPPPPKLEEWADVSPPWA